MTRFHWPLVATRSSKRHLGGLQGQQHLKLWMHRHLRCRCCCSGGLCHLMWFSEFGPCAALVHVACRCCVGSPLRVVRYCCVILPLHAGQQLPAGLWCCSGLPWYVGQPLHVSWKYYLGWPLHEGRLLTVGRTWHAHYGRENLCARQM